MRLKRLVSYYLEGKCDPTEQKSENVSRASYAKRHKLSICRFAGKRLSTFLFRLRTVKTQKLMASDLSPDGPDGSKFQVVALKQSATHPHRATRMSSPSWYHCKIVLVISFTFSN